MFSTSGLQRNKQSHSARVVHSTSLSDVTLRGRPLFGPYKSQFTSRRPYNVIRTSVSDATSMPRLFYAATNKDVRKTFIRAQSRTSAQRPWTSCRVGKCVDLNNQISQLNYKGNIRQKLDYSQ